MRSMIAILVALAMSALGVANARADRLQEILAKGTVRIAVSLDSPPFGYQDASGKPTGFDIDLAEMVAKALGVKLDMQPVTSTNRVAFLLTDKVDIVISNLGLTAERAKQILFSAPYVNTVHGVFGPKNIPVTSADQLGSYKVAGTKGGAATNAVAAANPKAILMQLEADSTAATALITGQADLIASSSVTVAAIAKQNPDKQIELKFSLRNSPAHMGVRMDQHNLVRWLDSFIFVSLMNGELDRLSRKYLSTPLAPVATPLPTL